MKTQLTIKTESLEELRQKILGLMKTFVPQDQVIEFLLESNQKTITDKNNREEVKHGN